MRNELLKELKLEDLQGEKMYMEEQAAYIFHSRIHCSFPCETKRSVNSSMVGIFMNWRANGV